MLVNFHLKADELAYILDDSQARVLVAHERSERRLRAGGRRGAVARDRRGRRARRVRGHDRRATPTPTRWPPPISWLRGARDARVLHVGHDRATEGRCARIACAARACRRRAAGAGRAVAVDRTTTSTSSRDRRTTPGPGGYVMSALFVGARSRDHAARGNRRVGREGVAAARRAERVTISFMTPAHFIRILEVPEAERAAFDLSSLRLIVHGGAPCPVPVKERILDALAPAEVWELYGASEGGATRISPSEWRERPGSVGTPWPGVEVRVLDDDGHALPAGRDGPRLHPSRRWRAVPLPRRPREDRVGVARRRVHRRRRRPPRRRRLPVPHRSRQRHGDPRRRQHLPARDRGRAVHASRRSSTARCSAFPTTGSASGCTR